MDVFFVYRASMDITSGEMKKIDILQVCNCSKETKRAKRFFELQTPEHLRKFITVGHYVSRLK